MKPTRLRRVMQTLFIVGWLAAAAATQAQQSPALTSVMEQLRAAGANKFFLAEKHFDALNPRHHLQVLDGLRRGGRLCFWSEIGMRPEDSEKALTDVINSFHIINRAGPAKYQQYRPGAISLVVARPLNKLPWSAYEQDFPDLGQFMQTSDFRAEWINFEDDTRRDLDRFINADGVNVARVGFLHAAWEWKKRDTLRAPYSDHVWTGLEWASFTSDRQKAMFGGFRKAVKKGPAVLVAQTSLWGYTHDSTWGDPTADAKARLAYEHYVNNSFAVLEFPFHTEPGNGSFSGPTLHNTSVVAPCELRSTMVRCAEQLRQAGVPVTLYHDPQRKCTRPALWQLHDEP